MTNEIKRKLQKYFQVTAAGVKTIYFHDNFCFTSDLKFAGLFLGDVETNFNRKVVGIVSFGTILCEESAPIVLTKVGFFVDWIEEKMASN